MPRRTSGMRMLRALNAEAAELTPTESPTPTPELPAAPEKQGFNFDAYSLGVKATKLAVRMRGKHYVTTARGRAFVQKIADHLESGELLEVAKMRDRYTFNELPNYAEHVVKLQAKIDASPYGPYGL